MKQLIDKYNKALTLIKDGRFEEARDLLKSILTYAPFQSETNQVLGLLEALSGNPVSALAHWDFVKSNQKQGILCKKEMVISNLSIYESVRLMYNQALSSSKLKDYGKAEKILKEIIEKKSDIPLPKEIYNLNIIILALMGKEEAALDLFSMSPLYVKTSPKVMALKDRIENKLEERTKDNHTNKKIRKRKKRIRIVTAFVGGAFLITAGSGILINHKMRNSFESEKGEMQEAFNSSLQYKNKIKELDSKLSSLETKKSSLERKLEEEKKKTEEREKINEFYEKTILDLSPSSVVIQKAKESFDKGYSSYKGGDFQSAKEQFQLSLALLPNQYFSDDASYYLIQTKKNLGELTPNDVLFDQFSNSKLINYKESPFRDDILLLKVESFLKIGDKNSALAILEIILKNFPNEWSAKYAQQLKQNILEES